MPQLSPVGVAAKKRRGVEPVMIEIEPAVAEEEGEDVDLLDVSRYMNKSMHIEAVEESREIRIMKAQEALITREVVHLEGRQTQLKFIHNFIFNNLSQKTGGSLYICGSPGTGKTACLLKIKSEMGVTAHRAGVFSYKVVKLNGFEMTSPTQIYPALLRKIKGFDSNVGPAKASEELEKIFHDPNNQTRYIVIIDEIDGLLQKAQRVLYKLFAWPCGKHANIILIGIANSMNITDRFLPRLRRANCEPELLVFPPYKKTDFQKIIGQRLSTFKKAHETDPYPFFDPVAIHRVTGKVASNTGDIRRCLELCRTALDTLLLPENSHLEKVGFLHMNNVIRANFDSPFVAMIQDLPFHQQVLIVTATIYFRHRGEISFRKLHNFYDHFTKKQSLPRVRSKVEFTEMVQNLASQGILMLQVNSRAMHKGSTGAVDENSRFKAGVQDDDVLYAVQSNEGLKLLETMLTGKVSVPAKYLH